ncbi:hypothetical protein N9H63_01275 [bacterium]|nr:hypothetical protein [bacterium]
MEGLKKILVSEQLKPKPGAKPIGEDPQQSQQPDPQQSQQPDPQQSQQPDPQQSQQPDPQQSQQPDPVTNDTEEVKTDESKEVQISQRMAEMFDVFRVFDREGTDYIKKLKDEDREIVKSRTLGRIRRELNDDLEKVDMSTVDDTFINYLINYMVVDKKMDPFYIEYTPDAVYKLSYDLVEVRGLGKVLLEQGFTTNTEKVFIQYTDGDNFKLVGGPGAANQAAYEYNRRGAQSPQAKETKVGQGEGQPEGEQPQGQETKKEEPQPNKNLLDSIYIKASDDGIDSVRDMVDKEFSSRQKRIIQSLNGEGYAVLRPINPEMYEEIDVKVKYSQDFEPFMEFKMYRPKTSGVNVKERASSLQELSNLQKITKGQCKELIEQYYEIGKVGDVDMSDEERKNAARQVYRCRRQHKFGGRLDFAKIGDKLDEIGSSRWGQDPDSGRFMINYNNGTVGNDDNVIQLK